MKLSNFISNCRNARVRYLHGRSVLTACGHCPDCMARKASHYTRLCEIESMSHKYTYFFTLTYDDVHIPRARYHVNPDARTITYVDYTSRPLKTKKRGKIQYKRVAEYGSVISSYCSFNKFLNLANFNKFVKKSCYSFKNGLDNPFYKNNLIRYARKRDLQNFLKRLRFHISELYNIPITFYAVSEYGPKYFRPHFHVCLYFDDLRLLQDLERLLHKSWKLGNVDHPELARSTGACANYVAKYCNSFTRLPAYLNVNGLRPFSLHSQNFGRAISSLVRDVCYQDVRAAAGEITFPTPFGVYTYYPNTYYQNILFPRCYNYDEQLPVGRYQLYTLYRHLKQLYPEFRTVSDLTRKVLTDPIPHVNFLKHLGLHPQGSKVRSACWFERPMDILPDHYDVPVSQMEDLETLVYNRLYTAINLSRRFLEFNCDGRDPETVIRLIDDFYSYSPLVKLCQQLDSQNEYYKETFDTDYMLFYPIVEKRDSDYYPDYRTTYDNSAYIKRINREKDKAYSDDVKHKEQNDANLMFVNP